MSTPPFVTNIRPTDPSRTIAVCTQAEARQPFADERIEILRPEHVPAERRAARVQPPGAAVLRGQHDGVWRQELPHEAACVEIRASLSRSTNVSRVAAIPIPRDGDPRRHEHSTRGWHPPSLREIGQRDRGQHEAGGKTPAGGTASTTTRRT
jgi:hypothetical protein